VVDEHAALLQSLLDANEAFYDAFERRDIDAMSDAWRHEDGVVCTHPGWSTLHGWAKVGASWAVLLANQQRLQFILTNPIGRLTGDAGWVTCEENILDGPGGSTVAALNVFERVDGVWKLVAHHGSVVHAFGG
jgi:limonene-1,2-epoxide hydrolase